MAPDTRAPPPRWEWRELGLNPAKPTVRPPPGLVTKSMAPSTVKTQQTMAPDSNQSTGCATTQETNLTSIVVNWVMWLRSYAFAL
jgi:hypothetical protein